MILGGVCEVDVEVGLIGSATEKIRESGSLDSHWAPAMKVLIPTPGRGFTEM